MSKFPTMADAHKLAFELLQRDHKELKLPPPEKDGWVGDDKTLEALVRLISAWRAEQLRRNHEHQDFIEKTVKPNRYRAMEVTYADLLKEYEAYIQQVKESLR